MSKHNKQPVLEIFLETKESTREEIIEEVTDLSSSSLYLNRELNWLDFNERVLNEALDSSLPLLEQLKFLSIFYSNLDEFFMVRVANVLRQYTLGVSSTAPDKLSTSKQLSEIRKHTVHLVTQAEEYWKKNLSKHLQDKNIKLVKYNDLTDKQKYFLDGYFKNEIYPVLTPQAIDPSHPFPTISNVSLNFIIELKDNEGTKRFARLRCPNNVSRFVFVPRTKEAKNYASLGFSTNARDNDVLLLEDLISEHLDMLFTGSTVINAGLFRITRNTDVEIEEDEASDLLEAIKGLVEQRRFGNVVRLEIAHGVSSGLVKFLAGKLHVYPFQIYRVKGPMAFSDMIALYNIDRPNLKHEPINPRVPLLFNEENNEIFYASLRQKDIFLYHPYDSFTPVLDFINRASEDANVVAIKQTLYRVGSDSPIVHALIEARRRGKQVTVVVELKARFDEERNITWAEEMEKAGVHVVYGLMGMKIHAKLCLVIRREAEGVMRYVHIATGNYNPSTAKMYTDMGVITAHKEICADVTDLFNVMTGYAVCDEYRQLFVSPHTMRAGLLDLIENEINFHKEFNNGHIIIKCNQLTDKELIQALYTASMEGVKVQLQIRGVCCLIPHILGISENIEVTSIVGRFLEHTRVFWFNNNKDNKMYIGSADMMERNLDRRIEVLMPILDEDLKRYIKEDILDVHLADNVKAYSLKEDGTYSSLKSSNKEKQIDSQARMLKTHISGINFSS